MTDRPTKITFGEMGDMGIRGLLVYCADHRCSHSIAINGGGCQVCRACCNRAEIRPDWQSVMRGSAPSPDCQNS
jgi:hypothetical protein